MKYLFLVIKSKINKHQKYIINLILQLQKQSLINTIFTNQRRKQKMRYSQKINYGEELEK